ncbi:glycoside hydrolase family 20 protein [Chitinophaga lutea]
MNSLLRIVLAIVVAGLSACSQNGPAGTAPKAPISLIPKPASLTPRADSFLLNERTVIVAASEADKQTAAFFNEYLQSYCGYTLAVKDSGSTGAIIFQSLPQQLEGLHEAYHLSVDNNRILVQGDDAAGTFYGMHTLVQLLPVTAAKGYWVPGLEIADLPRFAYRGLHLDVARHFFPVEFVKKYIDLMAMHKFNTFHWHLTDDQGWRIEIKKYPRLIEVASRRKETMEGRYADNKFDGKPYGGFYTQDQIREVVEYAQQRHVTIVPEIEMPGHALAVLAAYPGLGCTGGPYQVGTKWGVFDDVFCAGNDTTFTFLQNVLDEVMLLFPSKYIHIGGDECPKTRWEKCPKCQARIRAEGLKDEHALQSYFIRRMEKYLNDKGRQIIGWDEILEGGLAPYATVMSWRGVEGGITAAKQHHDVIMTPGSHLYFDQYQSRGTAEPIAIGGYLPVEKVYAFEPVPQELKGPERRFVRGAQANVWTEYIESPAHVEYMVYPRAVALSELLWSQEGRKDYDAFVERLKRHLPRLDKKGVNYAKHIFEVRGELQTDGKGTVSVALASKLDSGKITYTTNGDAPNESSQTYQSPAKITETCTFRAAVFKDGKPFGNEYRQDVLINKATGRTVTLRRPPAAAWNPGDPNKLLNGVRGNEERNNNEWFGFSGTDFDATVDLGDTIAVSSVDFLMVNQPDQWIHAPRMLQIFVSKDGKTFEKEFEMEHERDFSKVPRNQTVSVDFPKKPVVRYVRILARNAGTIPRGYAGEGSPAWLFVDEIQVY